MKKTFSLKAVSSAYSAGYFNQETKIISKTWALVDFPCVW